MAITDSDLIRLDANIGGANTWVEGDEFTNGTDANGLQFKSIRKLNAEAQAAFDASLQDQQYLPPVVYAGSISFGALEKTKTIERGGVVYAPVVSSLPFTTTGTWAGNDELNFYPIQNGMAIITTAGDLIARATSLVPAGYLECDGSAISRTTYAALFSSLGVIYGSGDGSTTFNIPDFRGEFLRGWDNGRGVDIGRAIATAQAFSVQSHEHSFGVVNSGTAGANLPQGSTGSSPTATNPTASFGGVETRPRNVAVMYCIKY